MNEKKLTIILIVTLSVIVLAGMGGVYYYQFVVAPDLNAQIAQLRLEVDDAKQKQAKIKPLTVELEKLNAEIKAIEIRIPPFSVYNENDKYADLIDRLRKKTGVLISDVRFKAPVKSAAPGAAALPPEVAKASYEYKVSGGFFQLLNFIHQLETEPRFLVAENIKFGKGAESASKGGSIPMRELSLTINTYMKKEIAAAAPAAGTPEKPTKAPEKPAPPETDKRHSTPPPSND